jgi:Carboxypeptidase regulatory-like domain/TonB-dependent Receptor Plug Domain
MPKRLPYLVGAIAVIAMCFAAVPAVAQFGGNTGGIDGKVVDEQGGVLPGVSVTLSGMGAAQTVYSDARGEFHIINLAPGTYTLTLGLQGFSTVNRENVTVSLGRNTELTVPMKLSSVAATVTVTGEVPVISTKKVETGAAITPEELKSIPTARDPWVVLQSVPGVQIDRVNVAGSESGQQSNFMAKGSNAGTFAVDGVNLTDMAALGASAGYYDFDSFQEMQVISGGADASISGSGTHLNMVTKRGTNEVHGSARIFAVDSHFQSDNLPEEALTQRDSNGLLVPLAAGNHINSVQDYGAEVGGPVWKDHMWLWGAYGRDQINLVTAGGTNDNTTLEDFNTKFNWQVIPSNTLDIWYMRSDKLKQGRSGGVTRPQETTWNQTTPQNTWKISDSQIVGSSFFFTAQYNGANGAFTLDPQGNPARQSFIDAEGVWHNTYEFFASGRPQRQVKADTSWFFSAGSIGNELKAGFGYLKAGARSSSQWPGDLGFVQVTGQPPNNAAQVYGDYFDCDEPCATITRQSNLSIDNKYWSAYLQDAITFDRLTVNLGVRWDQQYGTNNPTTIQGNPTPEWIAAGIAPTVNFLGVDKPFTWNDWQPRVGLTFALGENRTTVLKASYARYAEALGTNTTGQVNPTNSVAYLYYPWTDANADNLVQVNEVDVSQPTNPLSWRGIDPANQANGLSPNTFSSDFHAPKTWEIVGGIDHELFPAFAVGVAYTYRKFSDQLFRYPTGITRADYQLAGTFTGNLPDQFGGGAYSGNYYQIVGKDVPPGNVWTNRTDYDTTYSGFDVILTKRLSNRWMMRGSFTYNMNKQHTGVGGCVDPTNTVPGQSTDTGNPQTGYTAESCADDTFIATRSTGSGDKAAVFLNSKWQFNINAMYQLPWNFNIAASVFGREGYPVVPFRRAGADGTVKDVVLASVDDLRYDNVFEFDMRLEKLIPVTQTVNVTVSADCFNITNENTVLQRFNRIARTNSGLIKEIQSPRIWRFGARISF